MGRHGQLAFWYLLTMAAFASSLAAQQPAVKLAPLPPINPNQAHLSQTLGGLDAPGSTLAYQESSGILAAGSEQGTIHYWDKSVTLGVRTGDRTAQILPAHKGPVTALAWAKGGLLASAGIDNKLLLWAMPEGRLVHALPVPGAVRALSMTADGQLLASGGDSGIVQLWDTKSGKPGNQLGGHSDWILCL